MDLWLKRIRKRLKKLKALNKENHRIIFSGWKRLLLLSLTTVLGCIIFSNYIKADAQLIPIPPLSTDTKVDNNKSNAFGNDHKPPMMQILTDKLTQGKNVFKVKIIDESGIKSCEIRYINYGSIKTTNCVYDKNDIYKALISAAAPSQTVQVYAKDPNGNSATGVKNFIVSPQPAILDQISNIFSHLLRSLHLVT
jgi:hypothetical protein